MKYSTGIFCEDCGREMKPLLTSLYCPNDCDREKSTPKIGSSCPHSESWSVGGVGGTREFCMNCGKAWEEC